MNPVSAWSAAVSQTSRSNVNALRLTLPPCSRRRAVAHSRAPEKFQLGHY